MTSAAIAVVALACVLAGLFIAMLGVFLFILLRDMRKLTAAVVIFTNVQQAMADDKTLAAIVPTIKSMTVMLPAVTQGVVNMTEQIKVWNKLLFKSNELAETLSKTRGGVSTPPVVSATEERSQVYEFHEEETGHVEEVEQLERQGIDVLGKNVPEPAVETIHYSQS